MKWLLDDTIPRRLHGLVKTHAGATVTITGLITVLFVGALFNLRFENAPGKLDLPADDAVRADLDRFESRFGSGELLLIGLEFEDVIAADQIEVLRRLSDTISALPGVVSVNSLANAADFRWVPSFGIHTLRPVPLVPRGRRASDSAIRESIRHAAASQLYSGNIVSADGRAAAFAVNIDPWTATGRTGMPPLQELVSRIKELTLSSLNGEAEVKFAGPPILNIALQKAMRSDLAVFGPFSVIVFVVVMLLIFRAWRPVVIAFATAAIALIWTLGLLSLTDTPMSIGLSMAVPLILSLTLMYSVHHLSCAFRESSEQGGADKIDHCWQCLVVPGLLCGLTTWFGFLSLASSRLEGIREVGIYIGFGVLISSALANLFLPALLHLLRWPKPGGSPRHEQDSITGLVSRVPEWMLPRAGLFLVIVTVMSVVVASGMTFVKVETNHLAYLSRDRQTTEAFGFIDKSFGGVLPLEILVDVPTENTAGAIRQVLELEDSLRALEGIGAVVSAADFVARAEKSKPQGTSLLRPPLHLNEDLVPRQLWDVLTAGNLGTEYVKVGDSLTTIRVACRAHVAGSSRLRFVVERVQRLVDSCLEEFPTTVTGLAVYFVRVEDYVVSTQIRSFSLALAVTILLLGLISGALRLGIAVVCANLLPVAVVLGVMGWLSVPLDISTVMIAAIALGIVVDDTIHLIYRYRVVHLSGESSRDSIRIAFRTVGRPVLVTSIILSLGFGSLLLARFLPTAYFGGLSAVTVVVAAGADLLVLPALIYVLLRDR
jgi:predicted RND superfamily exporter protein